MSGPNLAETKQIAPRSLSLWWWPVLHCKHWGQRLRLRAGLTCTSWRYLMQTVCSFRKFLSITPATASGSMWVGFWSWIVVEAKVYQCEIVERGEGSSRARQESLLRSSGRQVLCFPMLCSWNDLVSLTGPLMYMDSFRFIDSQPTS